MRTLCGPYADPLQIDNTVSVLRYNADTGALALLDGVAPVPALPEGTAHGSGGGGAWHDF